MCMQMDIFRVDYTYEDNSVLRYNVMPFKFL